MLLLAAGCADPGPEAPRTVTRPVPPQAPFPKLSTVPERPRPPTPGTVREDEAKGLQEDRGSAIAEDKTVREEGPVPPPLPPDAVRPNFALLGEQERSPRASRGDAGPNGAAAPTPKVSGASQPKASPQSTATPRASAAPSAATERRQAVTVAFQPRTSQIVPADLARLDTFARDWMARGGGRLSIAAAGSGELKTARETAVIGILRRGGVPGASLVTGGVTKRTDAAEISRE